MKTKMLLLLLILALPALACGEATPTKRPEGAEVTATTPEEAQVAVEGPTPTDTSVPTATPTVAPTPTPEPIAITGTGDAVVDIQREHSPAIVRITGNAEGRHFAVKSYDRENNPLDLLVNTAEPYEGIRPLDLKETEHTTRLEIKAVGDWTIKILPVSTARRLTVPGFLDGKGDDVILLEGEAPDTAHITRHYRK